MRVLAGAEIDDAGAGTLPREVLERLATSLGADLSAVRAHSGPDAHEAARRIGAVAFTSGTDIYFSDGAYRPGTAAGFRLLAHEAVHVLQQARGPVGGEALRGLAVSSPIDPWEREAEACAELVARGRAVRGRGFPSTVGACRSSRTSPRPPRDLVAVQRHVSFEHRLLGDAHTADLVAISTGGPTRAAYLQGQIALLQLWRTNPQAVTAQQVTNLCPWIRTLNLGPDNVLVTYGEVNALPDYLANPMALDNIPASVLVPILQCIRQEGFNQITNLLTGTNPNVTFAGAACAPWKLSMVNNIVETAALDALTYGLGVSGADHYQGLLSRNACHFAPYSWYRWQSNHLIARDLAARAYAATDSGLKALLTQQAWAFDGYADHFLQDSFAAGHLINKTLVMQWFIEFAAGQSLLPIPDWPLIQNMTADQQPGLAGRALYNPAYAGQSNDPQTSEELVTIADRLVSSGLAVAGGSAAAIYQQFLTFLTSAVTQIASANLHDYYNSNSAWVSSPAVPTPYEVWGDDTLLSGANGGNGVQATSATAQMSQEAIGELLTAGATGITTAQIRSQFPTQAGPNSGSLQDLQSWNDSQKGFALSTFSNFMPTLKTLLLGLASPRLGTVSRDHDFSQNWYTSLPSAGYATVHTIVAPQGMFVGSNGRLLQLNPRTGAVLQNMLLTSSVGVGDYTTRVASDGSNLYVGVHGYVYAVSSASWSQAWSPVGVGGTGSFAPVDVLVQNGRVFAGSNGYVYELNPANGTVLHSLLVTSRFGSGDYTTRLASDGQNLYIGVHGYVYGMSLNNWSATTWNRPVGGTGSYDPVSVLCQGGGLFAGCNGYAYQLSTSGQITTSALVTGPIGVGDYTTRLASDGQNLYVGVHGYVYCLPLGGQWSASTWNAGVGGVGYNRVSVFTQKGRLFAGSNGYIYEIATSNGAVLHTLLLGSMTGLGNYDTTLTGDGHSLYPGAHGYSYKVVTLCEAGVGPLGSVKASAGSDGSVQVVALDENNTLWHTVRAANGTWQNQWGNVLANVPGQRIGQPRWVDIAASNAGFLNVLALDAQGTLWWTTRLDNGNWPTPWWNVQAQMGAKGYPVIGPISAVSAATDLYANLHVLALDSQNTLWHALCDKTGDWLEAWENVQDTMKGAGFPGIGPVSSVVAGCDPSGNLHLVAIDDAFQPWHTMRALDGTWPDPWTSVAAAGQGYASPRRVVGASANANGDLQVVVVDGQGMLWHTIRTANGTWPYPWGNVLGTVPGPNIGPTPFAAVSADPSSNLHVLVLDEQDQAWYTIRDADGSWPSAWLGVEAPAGS